MNWRAWGLAAMMAALLLGANSASAEEAAPRRRVNQITFFGLRHAKDSYVIREMGIAVGDSVSDDDIEAAQQRLEGLDEFAFIEIQPKQAGPGAVVLTVHAEERARAHIGILADYTRRFTVRPGIRVSRSNLRGTGDEAWISGQWGKTEHYAGGWSNTWVPRGVRLDTEIAASRERYRFMFEPFMMSDRAATLQVGHHFGGFLNATVMYAYRTVKMETADAAYFGGAVTVKRTDPALVLKLEHDGRDRPIYPARGIHALAEARFSGLGQDSTYQLYGLHVAGFTHFSALTSMGARASWRLAGGTVPVYERLYMGGPEDLRGIGFATLRGDESFTGTAEIRRPIVDVRVEEGSFGAGIHAFYDWGKAWDRVNGWGSEKMRHDYGLGLHLNLLQKSLRFEWAKGDDGVNSYIFGDEFTF